MDKKLLKTGMTVVLRNGDRYIVMLGTGMGGMSEDIIWKPNILSSHFGSWMPLCYYDDNLRLERNGMEFEREFDIVEVWRHNGPVNIGNTHGFDASMMYKGV